VTECSVWSASLEILATLDNDPHASIPVSTFSHLGTMGQQAIANMELAGLIEASYDPFPNMPHREPLHAELFVIDDRVIGYIRAVAGEPAAF
jgi:hypothetical protein